MSGVEQLSCRSQSPRGLKQKLSPPLLAWYRGLESQLRQFASVLSRADSGLSAASGAVNSLHDPYFKQN